jgi:hypothetical protein
MKYILLIYSNESPATPPTEAEMQTVMDEYNAFTADLAKNGHMIAGEALHATTTATTVRCKDGKLVTTDGPFAETKEQLGGYYVIDAKDLNEAIMWAGKIPGAKVGSIEVRPIMEF